MEHLGVFPPVLTTTIFFLLFWGRVSHWSETYKVDEAESPRDPYVLTSSVQDLVKASTFMVDSTDLLPAARGQSGEVAEHGGVLRFHDFHRQHHHQQGTKYSNTGACEGLSHSKHSSIHRASTKDRKWEGLGCVSLYYGIWDLYCPGLLGLTLQLLSPLEHPLWLLCTLSAHASQRSLHILAYSGIGRLGFYSCLLTSRHMTDVWFFLSYPQFPLPTEATENSSSVGSQR